MEDLKCIVSINKQRENLLTGLNYEIRKSTDEDSDVSAKDALKNFAETLCKRLSLKFLKYLTHEQLYQFIKQRFNFVVQYFSKELFVSIAPFPSQDASAESSDTALEFILKDRAFVIDSLVEYLREKKLDVELMVHPILKVKESGEGLVNIEQPDDFDEEKHLYVFTILKNCRIERDDLRRGVADLMEKVRCVTDDFRFISEEIDKFSMKKKTDGEEESESLEESERRRLFAWLNSGNAILLGSGELLTDELFDPLEWSDIGKPLGYVRRKKELEDRSLPGEVGKRLKYFLASGLYVNLIELGEFSRVHKKDRIQILFAKRKNKDGKNQVIFFYILFTDKSLKERVLAIPLARLKVNSVLEAHVDKELNRGQNSHLTKIAHDFFSIIPKSELFRLTRPELDAIFMQFLHFGDNQTTQVSTYAQPENNYARITFCLPNHKFSPDIFDRIEQSLFDRLQIEPERKYWFSLERNAYAHYIFWFPEGDFRVKEVDLREMEKEAADLTLDWEERFQEILNDLPSSGRKPLTDKYSNVFHPFYQAVFKPEDAVRDVEFIETLLETGREQADLRTCPDEEESLVYIFSKRKYRLTDIMPCLQNMSLTVIDENTYGLKVNSEQVYIYTYYVQSLEPLLEKFPGFQHDFRRLLLAVLEKRAENDPLNGLLLKADLNMEEINLFILYRNYYRQLGASIRLVNKSLLENAEVAVALKEYFSAKFNPDDDYVPLSPKQLSLLKRETLKAIDNVQTLADDIIFKNIFNLMEATVRSNYFNIDEFSALAVKVESAKVEYMPLPRPLYEIYVHGADMEGIHLRGAKIARGGIRHSDRHTDFRSEVLGLVNTQMIKNVIIVPEGSKGGFITKNQPNDSGEMAIERKKQYKIYINSLLSLTDNIVEGKVVPPFGMVRYDGDDSYFVVAADKGTAVLSDTANEISERRGFWLRDAFASGGRHGYDHKGMGITAKGAWECVKMHFLEEGKDIQKSDFSVIGIGDMGGDVFGNGMLLSKHVRLLGAFNHLHIFIDPDPDPEVSWNERKRLFDAPGSGWMDYDPDKISEGGGIFPRSAKSIALSPQIREMLATDKEKISGEEMIRLLLRCETDLLWNGGIGTYVKAASESSHEVGDAANDAVRINADQLKVKAVGEGGNLGLTQTARIEAALKGIKLNTDAVDNSGGVDTSDHEVNLKILMNILMEQGQIASMDERNKLLEDLTEDIAALVLEDNKSQGQIISMDSYRSRKNIKPFLELIDILTAEGIIDPRTAGISSHEKLNQFSMKGLGAPRPDLALLLSFSKMFFSKKLADSETLDDALLDNIYYGYFPESFTNNYDISKAGHPLKKEIIGTVLVNKMLNQAGVTLLPEILSIVETDVVNIVVAYMIINRAFRLYDLRRNIASQMLTKDINAAYRMFTRIEDFVKETITRLLFGIQDLELKFSMADDFGNKLEEFYKVFGELTPQKEKNTMGRKAKRVAAMGFSLETAEELVKLEFITNSLEIIILTRKTGISVAESTVLSKGIDSLFHFRILYNKILKFDSQSIWTKRHKALLLRNLFSIKHKILENILQLFSEADDLGEKLELFRKNNKEKFKKYRANYNQLMKARPFELSGAAALLEDISRMLI